MARRRYGEVTDPDRPKIWKPSVVLENQSLKKNWEETNSIASTSFFFSHLRSDRVGRGLLLYLDMYVAIQGVDVDAQPWRVHTTLSGLVLIPAVLSTAPAPVPVPVPVVVPVPVPGDAAGCRRKDMGIPPTTGFRDGSKSASQLDGSVAAAADGTTWFRITKRNVRMQQWTMCKFGVRAVGRLGWVKCVGYFGTKRCAAQRNATFVADLSVAERDWRQREGWGLMG